MDDIVFVLIVLIIRYFCCGFLLFINISFYFFKDFDVICCFFLDEMGGFLD